MSWYFKSDLRLKGDTGWTPYSAKESQTLEEAFQNEESLVKLNAKYKVNLKNMFQFRIDDESKQRDVKREEGKKKKKQKVSHEGLVGKKVYVVAHRGGVIGVYASEEEADEAKQESDVEGVKVYKKTIK